MVLESDHTESENRNRTSVFVPVDGIGVPLGVYERFAHPEVTCFFDRFLLPNHRVVRISFMLWSKRGTIQVSHCLQAWIAQVILPSATNPRSPWMREISTHCVFPRLNNDFYRLAMPDKLDNLGPFPASPCERLRRRPAVKLVIGENNR
jgi:hypothetical protein